MPTTNSTMVDLLLSDDHVSIQDIKQRKLYRKYSSLILCTYTIRVITKLPNVRTFKRVIDLSFYKLHRVGSTNVKYNIYTEGKKKCKVNIVGDLILFIQMFLSILIYKDKNTNLINKFVKFH